MGPGRIKNMMLAGEREWNGPSGYRNCWNGKLNSEAANSLAVLGLAHTPVIENVRTFSEKLPNELACYFSTLKPSVNIQLYKHHEHPQKGKGQASPSHRLTVTFIFMLT